MTEEKKEEKKSGWKSMGEKKGEEKRKLFTKDMAASLFNKAKEQGEVKSKICAVVYGFQGTGN